jgi:hypothetical protein
MFQYRQECGSCKQWCYTAFSITVTTPCLNDMYAKGWVGWSGPTEWSVQSPNLIPPHFYLWSHFQNTVYAVAVNKSAELKPSVEDGHVKICNMPRTFKHMQQSLTSCTEYIIRVKQKPSKQFSNLLLSRSNTKWWRYLSINYDFHVDGLTLFILSFSLQNKMDHNQNAKNPITHA